LTAEPATAFPEFRYITVILSYVFASNCSMNCLNLWLLFLSLIFSGWERCL